MAELKTPLADAVAAYIAKGRVRGHMPGHKGKSVGYLARFGDLAAWDVTEADGLDDLHSPVGAIAEAAALMADAVGAKCAHLLVNGASVGIQAAILTACAPGDTLLLPRNAHRAVWAALALGDVRPLWLPVAAEEGLPLALSPKQLNDTLAAHPEVKAVFLLNPSFYGVFGDLRECIAVAHSYGVLTIIDEAHGAHLPFVRPELAAARLGADLAVDSWHKSMGSLGQTAVLLNNRADLQPERWLTLLQTSSPSYPLLASLDWARAEWQGLAAERREGLRRARRQAEAAFEQLAALRLIGGADLPLGFAYDDTKLLFYSSLGHSGWQISEALRACGVEPEFADSRFVLFLLTYADGDLTPLCGALQAADRLLAGTKPQGTALPRSLPLPRQIATPFVAAHSPWEYLPLRDSAGRVAAGLLTPYPPGIPLVGPGEEISAEIIAELLRIISGGGRVQGIEDGLVPVLL